METNEVLSKTSLYQGLQSLHGLLGLATEDSSLIMQVCYAKIFLHSLNYLKNVFQASTGQLPRVSVTASSKSLPLVQYSCTF